MKDMYRVYWNWGNLFKVFHMHFQHVILWHSGLVSCKADACDVQIWPWALTCNTLPRAYISTYCSMTYHSHDSLTQLPSSRQYYPFVLPCSKVGTNLQSLQSLSTLVHKDRLIGGYFPIVQPPACASGSTSKWFLFLPIIGELLQSILT